MTDSVVKTVVYWTGAAMLACLFGCAEEAEPTPRPTVPTTPIGQQQPVAGAAGAPAGGMMQQPVVTDQAAATNPAAAPAAGAPVPDPSCPNYVGEALGMPIDLPGCCMPEGVCGVISDLRMMCITSSMILTDLVPGPPCTP